VRAPRGANADTSARCGWATLPRDAFHHILSQAGRVYIAITSKGYPSRYIYGSPDGSTRGILAGAARAPHRSRPRR